MRCSAKLISGIILHRFSVSTKIGCILGLRILYEPTCEKVLSDALSPLKMCGAFQVSSYHADSKISSAFKGAAECF